MIRISVIATLFAFLASCTVGPDYKPPKTEPPAAFISADNQSENGQAPLPDSAWWEIFGDPTLVQMVDRALSHNYDLRIARTRILEARAARDVSAGGRLPNVGAAVDVSRQRASEESPGLGGLAQAGLVDVENTVYRPGAQVSWEIDLFGKTRRSIEVATARLEATLAEVHGVKLTIIAETCAAYVDLRGAQQQFTLAEKNIRLQEASLKRVRAKKQAGLASGLDVARAEALLAGTKALLPSLRARTRANAFGLAVLTGNNPADLLFLTEQQATMTEPPRAVPTGMPGELLRRRPDLIAAERNLHAATAEVGVAIAQLYPSIAINGSYAWEATSAGNLFSSSAATWLFGGLINWPIFQGGRLRANIRAVKARNEAAYLIFEKTLLTALADVETALTAFREARLERVALAEAVDAAQRAVDKAQVLYDKGLGEYLDVLDAERTLTNQEDQLAQSETRMHKRTIQLYKALGGGWQTK